MRQKHWISGRTYTYLNTNPVHVLRSWFGPQEEFDETELVPFCRGKQHLQPYQRSGTGSQGLTAKHKIDSALAANSRARLQAARGMIVGQPQQLQSEAPAVPSD